MARKGRRSSHEKRIHAIQLLEQGKTKPEVARILGVAESSIYVWQNEYRRGGLAAILTCIWPEVTAELSRVLRLNPRQLEFDFGLWTRRRVRELILKKFAIDQCR